MTSSARSFIGKYEIVQTLGAGGMGTVYLGYDAAIARHVAVKTIRKDMFDARTAHNAIARFRQEAIAAGRLSHPGIVGVYDYGEEEALAYIIMEYAPGEDLERYLERRASGPEPRPIASEVATLMAQLLDALGYAHAAGVVHRDIKPSNLFLSGRLKISDFGIARVDRSELTQTGIALGTPAYMAPEQYRGTGIDQRADLFSSGVVFYELLTGALPFEGESVPELAYKICHVEPTPATRLRPDLPVEVDAVLRRALAKAKEARFSTAAEMAVAVADAMNRVEPASRSFVGAPTWTVSAAMRAMNAANPVEVSQALPVSSVPPEVLSRPSAVTPEALDRVAQALAKHVGPIARVMVKKAGVDATSYRDLCLKVSARLGTEDERARFLKEVGVS